MRKSKKMLSALAITTVFGLVAGACGSDEKKAATTTAAATETTAAAVDTTAAATETTAAATEETTAVSADVPAETTAESSDVPSGTCEAGEPVVSELPTLEADGAGTSVGLLFDVTGRGDKSFNDSAAAGLDKAVEDFGIEGIESTPEAADGSDRPDRIKQVVEAGPALTVGVGFLWQTDITQSAKDYPDQNFALVDAVATDDAGTPDDPSDDTALPNVRNIVFAANEASFLVGVAAACASTTGKVGFIGGVEISLIQEFQAGFEAGVAYANPDATVEVKYISVPPDFTGFNDSTKGKSTAAAMYASGIDVIYHAAGGSGKGLFEAAVEAGEPGEVWAIGVDSDQYLTVDPTQQPYILTSALKRVDVGTYEAIAAQLDGSFTGEIISYDLESGGVGYSASNPAINDYAGTIEAAKAAIIDGSITVP